MSPYWLITCVAVLASSSLILAQQLPREQWGAPAANGYGSNQLDGIVAKDKPDEGSGITR